MPCRAATIPCGWETASTSHTGTTGCSSSTFLICRVRRWWPRHEQQPGPSTSRPIRCLPIPGSPQGPDGSWWWQMRTWRSCGHPPRRSPGSTTSPTKTSRCRSATYQVPGLDTDDGSPQPPMMGCHQPSEVFQRHGHSLRVVRAGSAAGRHRRPIRSEAGGFLPAGSAARLRARLVQRRHLWTRRADLSRRPAARPRHHRTALFLTIPKQNKKAAWAV